MNSIAEFAALEVELDVSRETVQRLKAYAALLKKWNPRINLVGKTTISDLCTRHFRDSAQVARLIPDRTNHLVDLGSGGGFPGIVLAILSDENTPDRHVTLIESDGRKATFLRTVVRDLGLKTAIVAARIEQAEPMNADVLTARALAPLSQLLAYAERHLNPAGSALFMKGENFRSEIDEALASWRFTREEVPSQTAEGAVILKIGAIERV